MKTSVLFLLVSASLGCAADITLEWLPSGASAKFGYYKPVSLQLAEATTELKLPEGIKSPRRTTLTTGSSAKPVNIAIVMDLPEGGDERLWVDTNHNGDLTDDPATTWTARSSTRNGETYKSFSGSFVVRGEGDREMTFRAYRFAPNDSSRARLRDVLLIYRDFGFAGEGEFAGKQHPMLLSDDSASGNFLSGDVRLMIDLNANGKIESRGESFSATKPFNIGGTTWEVAGLTAAGGVFQIVKSTQTVAETPVPADTTAGKPAAAFSAETTAGKKVQFPADYQGKLVMLDFWATWCGPCIAELPNLTQVFGDLHDKGLEILGISLDSESSMGRLPQFTKDKHMTWPQICDGKGWEADLATLYGVRGIPACFLVDGTSGKILASGSELRGASLRTTIEKHLGIKSTPGSTIKPPAAEPPPAAAVAPPDPLLDLAAAAVKSGRFLNNAAVVAQLQQPKAGIITLAEPVTQPKSSREIASIARAGYLRAGWYFRCTKCDKMHLNLAGAYAIAPDVVATAHHVIEPPATLKDGWLIIVNEQNDIHAASSVLAADARMDAALLRVSGGGLQPLALRGAVAQGETAFCYSDPLKHRGYFSAGIVNRIYANDPKNDPAAQRMNVSTDWAQGSSGAAILDDCGNAIGHVARIQTFNNTPDKASPGKTPGTTLVLHEAIPARAVLQLVQRSNEAATKK